MIKEQKAALQTSDLCQKHGLSAAPFYKLKAEYGGMERCGVKWVKQLDDRNATLECLLAVAMVDNMVLNDLPGKP